MIAVTTKNKGSNYLAKVVRLRNLRKHSNADRLQCVAVDGNNVITGLDAKDGDVYVYFPLETAISKDFLRSTNSFEDPSLNADISVKGFFHSSGRVRAIRLRQERSEGYIVPAAVVERWASQNGSVVSLTEHVDVDFDTIGGYLLCEKYVVSRSVATAKSSAKKVAKATRTSKLIDGQFRLAEDTAALKKNLHKINPVTHVTIAYKMHGCNFSMGRVLCKRPLKWYERILKRFGVAINDTHYDTVYASRRVIKNQYDDPSKNPAAHWYTSDVWGDVCERYEHTLKDGITIHGEIVGQLGNGGWIQNGYDYGTAPKTSELYVYRVFYTSPGGDVFEFNTEQMVRYCSKVGLKTVPIYFNGPAIDLTPEEYEETSSIEVWREKFLARLTATYLEKDCHMCVNKVPEEGVCILLNSNGDSFEALKLKSFRFLERETKELDKGTENIDEVVTDELL